MNDDMQDLVHDFVTESREHLTRVESDLLAMEKGGADAETVNNVFRCVHSVKGVAGFLGFERINQLAHSLESTLDLVRKDRLQPTQDLVEVLLAAIDKLGAMVERAAESNDTFIDDHVESLRAFQEGRVPPPSAVGIGDGEQTQVAATSPAGEESWRVPTDELHQHLEQGRRIWKLQLQLGRLALASGCAIGELPDRVALVGPVLRGSTGLCEACSDGEHLPRDPVTVVVASDLDASELQRQLHLDPEHVEELRPVDEDVAAAAPLAAVATTAASAEVVAAPRASVPPTPTAATADKAAPAKVAVDHAADSIRVSVGLLDRLMTLSGELVLGRNQLMQAMASGNGQGRDLAAGRLNQVVSEMQEAIMQTRMQPVGNVFQRFPRVVRDLAQKLGKKCRLVTEGKEVELDRSILEALGDPLTHLVRNSVDHGVEMPELRAQRGKPAEGTLQLQAFHQGGNVKILVSDDGAGIDAVRLKQKALERSVITPEQAKAMNDREAVHLIFAPGFSTAEKVTDVSGRGVGMDVVRSNIERLGGSVEVQTVLGKGTTMVITMPLTLAILPSLVVSCGERRYVLPQSNVSELVRIRKGENQRRIVAVKGRPVLRLRGRLLPVVRLRDVVGTDLPPVDDVEQAQNIMVVETGVMQYGLVVDSPPDAEEVVVKPLGRHLKGRAEYAGCTILGDGRVAMILDLAGVAAASALKAQDRVEERHPREDAESQVGEEATDLVLFRNHPDETFAVPLGLVGRIQRVPRQEVVAIASGLVHSTGERAMPLLRLEEQIKAQPAAGDADRVSILVLRIAGEEVGLIVPRIEDIRSLAVSIDSRTLAEPGVLGSFQLQERTVRLLDVDTMARHALPRLFVTEHAPTGAGSAAAVPPRVLFAEDSGFFRSHVSRILENAGFTVTAAEDGDLAWQQLQRGDAGFDVVVTDIQMPNCDGLELTRRIRRSERWKGLPVLALTSLSSEEDVAAGRAAGISDYRVKLDDSALIAAVWQLSGVKA